MITCACGLDFPSWTEWKKHYRDTHPPIIEVTVAFGVPIPQDTLTKIEEGWKATETHHTTHKVLAW